MSEQYDTQRRQIDDYLLGELSPEEMEIFETYCLQHPDFMQEVDFKRKLIISSKKTRPTSRRFQSSFWYYAAAAVLLLVALFLIQDTTTYDFDTSRLPLAEERFLPNKSLEYALQNQSFRNETRYRPKNVSPPNGAIFDAQLEFSWEYEQVKLEDSVEVVFKLIDNQFNSVFEQTVIEPKIILPSKYEAGRYYWSLERPDLTMIYLGKVFIYPSAIE